MALSKRYREWNPDQSFLLPPAPREWLPEDHLAFFLIDVVRTLDLREIVREVQRKDHRGTRPYDPELMVALLMYGSCVGVLSSRKIELATYADVAFRVIAADQHPDHTALSEFRRRHLKALGRLFVQTVRLAQKAGLVSLGRVALDGTKVRANASKHKAMSYDRMLKSEKELTREIEELLRLAERTDREEDERYGRDHRGDEVPEELRRRESRLKKIQEAKAELEAEAAQARAVVLEQNAAGQRAQAATTRDPVEQKRALTRARLAEEQAAKLRGDDDEQPPSAPGTGGGLPHHRVPATPDGKPTPKAQRNFTDPESRIMKQGQEYMQGYNGQAVVDEKHQIILASGLSNQCPDSEYFEAMIESASKNCGARPGEVLADNGYWAAANVGYCERRRIAAYIATGRLKHGEPAPTTRGRPPRNLDAKRLMRRKLHTKGGRRAYSRRKVIVEPVFGQLKSARGLRQFLLRGLDKVRSEWDLWNAGHNLLKLHRAGWQPA